MVAAEGQEILEVKGSLSPLEFQLRHPQLVGGETLEILRNVWQSIDASKFKINGIGTIEWHAEPDVARFIAYLTVVTKAKCVIEIGSFVGFTSCHIATALQLLGEGNLYCIDIEDYLLTTAKNNLRKFNCENLVLPILGNSLDPQVIEKLPQAEIIFIDSSHEYETTRREIEIYIKKLHQNGYLVLHDSIRFPGVRRAVSECNLPKMTFATSRGAGLTIISQS